MNTTHRHSSVKYEDYGFSGPVAYPENPAAHGNICRVDTCQCGATRDTNINQRHIERGPWQSVRHAITGSMSGGWTSNEISERDRST